MTSVRRLLGIAFLAVLSAVLALALLVGYGIAANARAEQEAAEFCADIAATGRIAPLLQRAERDGIRYYTSREPAAYHFVFPGWVFNAGVCRAEVEGEVIRATRWRLEGD